MQYIQVCYTCIYKPTLSGGPGEERRTVLKWNERHESVNWIQVADKSSPMNTEMILKFPHKVGNFLTN